MDRAAYLALAHNYFLDPFHSTPLGPTADLVNHWGAIALLERRGCEEARAVAAEAFEALGGQIEIIEWRYSEGRSERWVIDPGFRRSE